MPVSPILIFNNLLFVFVIRLDCKSQHCSHVNSDSYYFLDKKYFNDKCLSSGDVFEYLSAFFCLSVFDVVSHTSHLQTPDVVGFFGYSFSGYHLLYPHAFDFSFNLSYLFCYYIYESVCIIFSGTES